jgi:zinc protease
MSYPGPETIHRHVLDNGIVVLIYQNMAVESVVIEGLVRAGALAETREQAGLANFTAEMLTRGSERRSFEQIYEDIESVGASIHFSGGRHVSDFYGHGLAEDLNLLLELISDCLQHPTFPENQVEAVRGEILSGLHIRSNDTEQMAALAFREKLYQDHPYGQSIDGYHESVNSLNREHLLSFHTAHYGPRAMILTVVGGIEPEEVLTKIQSTFGRWQTTSKELPPILPARRPTSIERTQVKMAHKTQADIILGLPGPLRSAPDYLEASLADTILGVFGMMGRLGQVVREENGLAYYIYSHLQGSLGPSPWYVAAGVKPNHVERVIDYMLQEIDRLRNEPIQSHELADCLAYRTGSLPLGLETSGGLASMITDMELFELGLDYLHKLTKRINRLTPEQVQAAAYKYLSSDEITIAVAGPNDSPDDYASYN